MKAKWRFEKTSPMGGAAGEAFRNTLQATGAPETILAREAIQNSCDAALDAAKVRVVFRQSVLRESAKKDFLKSLGVGSDFTGRLPALNLPNDCCLCRMDDGDLPLLYIEDYNTHGLHGDPHDSSSHFHRLLLSLGDSSKSRDTDTSGGSYGYGKSVYSGLSRINTIVAYSVFDAVRDRPAGVCVMGCSYFQTHKHDADSYTGRAWFGEVKKALVDPVEGQDAHDLAAVLGFQVRSVSETGTSILIVDCTADTSVFTEAIEQWWWPRLIENNLDVEIHCPGRPVQPPRPRQRDDLRPFIECYDLALGRSEPRDGSQDVHVFNKLDKTPLGCIGLQSLVADQDGADELSEKANSVALVREPRMVVSYLGVSGTAVPVVGVFVAAPEVDRFLRQSEPASHDKWDPKSPRLNNELPEASRCVAAVIDRVKQRTRTFASKSLPPPSRSDEPPKMLLGMLGDLFRPPSKPGSGGGGSEAEPFTIQFKRSPYPKVSGESRRTSGQFHVDLSRDFDGDTAKVIVYVACEPVREDGTTDGDTIPVKITCRDAKIKSRPGNPPGYEVILDKESRPLFEFESDDYSADWTTKVTVSVTRSDS